MTVRAEGVLEHDGREKVAVRVFPAPICRRKLFAMEGLHLYGRMDPAAGGVRIVWIRAKDGVAMMFFQRTYKPWLPTSRSWRTWHHKTAARANNLFMQQSYDSAAGSWKDDDFVERTRASASWTMGVTESKRGRA